MNHLSPSRGFTLIELVVSMGIFFIFITVLSGVFSGFMAVERHSIAQGVLILEVQSLIESFIKEARTGYGSTYEGTNDGKIVMFRNQQGVCVLYRVTNGRFERAEAPGSIGGFCGLAKFQGAQYVRLNSTSMNISNIYFEITHAQTKDSPNQDELKSQGLITINLTAESATGDIPPITIQNTVTSRQVRAYDK